MSLSASVLDSDVYSTSYSKLLTEHMNPVWPTTAQGDAQVYDENTAQCTPVMVANVQRVMDTAASCGGDPFQVQLSNTCYSTNTCATSTSMSTTCLNSQHVPVEKPTLTGPGVIYNAMPNNYWWI